MPRRHNPILQWVLTSICLSFAWVAGRLPLPLSRGFGRFFGRLAYYLIPRIRGVGLPNLDLAYGDTLAPQEKIRILKEAAENVGIVAAEFAWISELSGEFLAQHIACKGIERLHQGRGSVVVGAHLGNWEWMTTAICASGLPMAEVVRPLDDARLNAYVDKTRRAKGVVTIAKDGAGREVIQLLRQGWVVAVLIDQSPSKNAVPVRFFGEPCWGTIAPVMAALRARVPIYPMAMTRERNGDYTFEVFPEVPIVRSGDLRRDLIENAQRCQDAVESLVRRWPGQWLWLHRRWKDRPKLDRRWRAHPARNDDEPKFGS